MKRAKQLEFFGDGFTKPGDVFGGSLLKGNARSKRPLDSKLPIHLTLRAQKSVLRLQKTFKSVMDLIDFVAKKHGVIVYKKANVGNHLHLVIKIPNLRAWPAFIRELTGQIAQVVTEILGSEFMETLRTAFGGVFWRFKPHTRIVRGWRKAFKSALQYVYLNQLEAEGHIKRSEIKSLRDLRLIWADG